MAIKYNTFTTLFVGAQIINTKIPLSGKEIEYFVIVDWNLDVSDMLRKQYCTLKFFKYIRLIRCVILKIKQTERASFCWRYLLPNCLAVARQGPLWPDKYNTLPLHNTGVK